MTERHESEKEAIRQLILDTYHEGHAQHDAAYYESILHPEWKFFLLDEAGQLRIVDQAEYCSWYDPADRDPDQIWETEFLSVDVTGHIAAVKLRLECQKVRFIDYFNMMKIDDRWWIVHKMSHGTQKSA